MNLGDPTFKDGPSMLIVGLDQGYTFGNISEIPEQWHRFVPYLGAIPGQVGKVAYGVCHEMTMSAFRYLAGVEVTESKGLPEGFTALQLPPQRYAVFAHQEHVSKICETVDAIWQKWLPSSGCRVLDSPLMLERYGEGFDPEAGSGDIEIWMAIQS